MSKQRTIGQIVKRAMRGFVLTKRCPFCNSPKEQWHEKENYYADGSSCFYVRCGKASCAALGPQSKTYRKAILLWNKAHEVKK